MRLTGKVAIVTGGTRGLGRAIAGAYAAAGASVAICGRDARALAEAQDALAEAGARALAVCADVSRADDVERLIATVIEMYGRVDVLVNNAGVAPHVGPLLATSTDAWVETLAVNLTGAFYCVRAVASHLAGQRSGSIVNVSSRLGRGLLHPDWGTYGVSKWGVEGLTHFAASELQPYGVRVNSVAPGLLATAMSSYQGAPAESVVDVFVFLASDESRGVSGRMLSAASWRDELGGTSAKDEKGRGDG